jgi:hypothetical protein
MIYLDINPFLLLEGLQLLHESLLCHDVSWGQNAWMLCVVLGWIEVRDL